MTGVNESVDIVTGSTPIGVTCHGLRGGDSDLLAAADGGEQFEEDEGEL
jgi:hypothetical protein